MKKIFTVLLCCLITSSFSACGDDDNINFNNKKLSSDSDDEIKEVETEKVTTEEITTEEITTEHIEIIDYEDIYYRYIENELASQYGISDLAGFEKINWDSSPIINDIPPSTQGIIGANIYDYDSDGHKECLIIRQNQCDYIIDCYDYNLNLLSSYTASSFETGGSGLSISFNISMLDNYIIIEKSSMSIPSLSNYGTDVIILSLSNGKLIETLKFGGFRHAMQQESLYLNNEEIASDILSETEIESMKNKISQQLQSTGISFNTLETGWIGDSAYGVNIEFAKDTMMLFDVSYNDGLSYFMDYTNLRGNINIKESVASTTEPATVAPTNPTVQVATENWQQPSSTLTGKVVTQEHDLNVRQYPYIEAPKIGTIAKGSLITILFEVNGWYEIEFNDGLGYVSEEFIDIIAN